MIVYSGLYDENILHFIGQWQLATDGARIRDELLAFRRPPEQPEDPGDIIAFNLNSRQHHAIPDYIPGLQYRPPQWDPAGDTQLHLPRLPAWSTDLKENPVLDATRAQTHWPSSSNWPFPSMVQGIDAPGQALLLLNQAIYLQDNDILDLVGLGVPELDPMLMDRLFALAARADAVDILHAMTMPHTASDLGVLVTHAHEVLSQLTAESPNVVAIGPTLSGGYMNGQSTSEPPLLDDLLPAPFLPDEDTGSSEFSYLIETQAEVDDALVLQAGANLAMNAATITNLGLLGGVVAVAGDVYQVNAILQSNAYSDTDNVNGEVIKTADNSTATYNYALFSHVPMQYASPAALSDQSTGPLNWVVSVVDGDLIFSQWIKQKIFILDNDIHVLTETGASSNFVTGANMAQNILNFSDLGNAYDLILIGGNLFNANVISQLNVLLDDDFLDLGGASGTRANTSAETSGNLLYNGATITEMGVQNWTAGLPDHYLEALERLSTDGGIMPTGFAHDAAFAGLDTISVLAITGNVYDISYISQTNIVGDSDLVAAAEAAALQAAVDTDQHWDISTGDNALINTAAILDTDSLGDIAYVGGQMYSDAVLIQSDILADASKDDPDALVNEAIAFITPDDGTDAFATHDGITSTPADSEGVDVMSSVLA